MIRTRSHALVPGGLLLGLGLLPALAPADAAAGAVCPETEDVALIAGKNTTAGEVKVCNDTETLSVTYEPTGPWCVADTDLHVATGLDGIPRTKSGAPTPDQFAYGGPPEGDDCTVTVEIPLDEIGTEGVAAEDTVVIAAQADLFVLEGDRQEDAWGAGTRFTERGTWATYFPYTVEEPILCGGEDSLCVFVTSSRHNGNLGGLAGADAICNARATEASLPGAGNYLAWLSDDSASPATRFDQADTPYRLVDGALVADGWSDLTDGDLTHPINNTERLGVRFALEASAWTATGPDGHRAASGGTCQNWQAAISLPNIAVIGGTDVSDPRWTEAAIAICNQGLSGLPIHLYCFQQP